MEWNYCFRLGNRLRYAERGSLGFEDASKRVGERERADQNWRIKSGI